MKNSSLDSSAMIVPKVSVLLITFNRPEYVRKLLELLRDVHISRLYIANDGPRKDNTNDEIKCRLVRDLVREIDWDCEVLTRFSDVNLGCKNGVISAIDWFFQNEDEGIILEDDIIPDKTFFPYAEIMLGKYVNSTNVKAVLGFNYHGQNVINNSYFFYEGFYPWGWATWKRVWQEFNPEQQFLKPLKDMKKQRKHHRNLYNSLLLNLSLIQEGILDTWDYQFMYMMVLHNGIAIAPFANLTKNIGVDGAHSLGNKLSFEYGTLDIDKIIHPIEITIDNRMNNFFLMEHKHASKVIFVKTLLLKMGLYRIVRLLVRKWKLSRREASLSSCITESK